MWSQTPHQHVVLHPLAERADRCAGRDGSHGEFLSLKGTPWSAGDLSPLKAQEYRATSRRATLPRSGFVLWSLLEMGGQHERTSVSGRRQATLERPAL